MTQELNAYELKTMRQSKNMADIKRKIEKEEAKEFPDQVKLDRWNMGFKRTERAFRRTQVMAY